MSSFIQWHGQTHPQVPLFITVPHSGEWIPPEAGWLKGLSEPLLLTDLDRFVDQIYRECWERLPVPALVTRVHRYAVDLNRYPEDVDRESVAGASAAAGTFSKGIHWVLTTKGDRLMHAPISRELHNELIRKYHDPFHDEIAARVKEFRARSGKQTVYHLDCHSMPSQGTGAHRDQGQKRADVVISDQNGKSASAEFKDLVIRAFEQQGFNISYNWPYLGGRITERYGNPAAGHHTIQIELNRALYMNETTREKLPEFSAFARKAQAAIGEIVKGIAHTQ